MRDQKHSIRGAQQLLITTEASEKNFMNLKKPDFTNAIFQVGSHQ